MKVETNYSCHEETVVLPGKKNKMKQPDFIKVFFSPLWQIFLFYDHDNIGADLTRGTNLPHNALVPL